MGTRRQFLRVTPLALVGFAGCLGGQNGPDASGTSSTATPTQPAATRSPEPTASPPPTTVPTDEPPATDTPTATPASTATPQPTPTPEPTATATVRLSGGAFEPRRLAVEPNTLVRWVNDDPDSHRIRSMQVDESTTPWEFTSASFGRGQSVRHVFGDAGVFAYFSPTWGRSTSCGLVRVGDVDFDGDLPCESGY